MQIKNNTQNEDDIIGKRFTTYVELAVKRRRRDYCMARYREMKFISPIEEIYEASSFDLETEIIQNIPGWMALENKVLREEFQNMSDRNFCIFWNHVVEKESLANIARALEMPYDTVTAIYYRTLKSIKEAMLKNG